MPSPPAAPTVPAAPSPWLPRPVPIRARTAESETVWTLELDVADWPGGAGSAGSSEGAGDAGRAGGTGFPFAAGQFNMLYAFGVGEAAISISGDPAQPTRLVHTIRAVGAVTRALAGLPAGDVIGVRGPYGRGWPMHAARGQDVLIVAGGLGLAPLRPALLQILADRAAYGQVTLVYGARQPADRLYRDTLAGWAARPDLQVVETVDHADAEWRGRVGVVTAALDAAVLRPERTLALLCGPEAMMRFTQRALERRGVPDAQIYLSLERNMKCALGFCGHCQYGPTFVCKDGPVVPFDRLRALAEIREV